MQDEITRARQQWLSPEIIAAHIAINKDTVFHRTLLDRIRHVHMQIDAARLSLEQGRREGWHANSLRDLEDWEQILKWRLEHWEIVKSAVFVEKG